MFMIRDRIGRHEVLLPIIHNYNRFERELGETVLENEQTAVLTTRYASKELTEKELSIDIVHDGAYYPITKGCVL